MSCRDVVQACGLREYRNDRARTWATLLGRECRPLGRQAPTLTRDVRGAGEAVISGRRREKVITRQREKQWPTCGSSKLKTPKIIADLKKIASNAVFYATVKGGVETFIPEWRRKETSMADARNAEEAAEETTSVAYSAVIPGVTARQMIASREGFNGPARSLFRRRSTNTKSGIAEARAEKNRDLDDKADSGGRGPRGGQGARNAARSSGTLGL